MGKRGTFHDRVAPPAHIGADQNAPGDKYDNEGEYHVLRFRRGLPEPEPLWQALLPLRPAARPSR